MRIDELNPDEVLAQTLDGRVTVRTSETESHTVRCYADNRMPSTDLDDEFLCVTVNGPVISKTQDMGPFKGNLALTVYCRLLDDGTVRTRRIRDMIGQCAGLAQGRCLGGFVFRIDPSQVITPTTPDTNTGYAMKTINIQWRTI